MKHVYKKMEALVEMESVIRVRSIWKGRNPNILSQAMGKWQDTLGTLALIWQPVWEKKNTEFKHVKLCLKIDLVSYPSCAQGLDKCIQENMQLKYTQTQIMCGLK